MEERTYSCGLEAALSIVGGKWTSLILFNLAAQPRRFGELRRLVTGISEKMLTQELRKMESDGIVNRTDFGEVPPHVEYALTPFGKDLASVLAPLCEWGSRHMKRIGRLPSQAGGSGRYGRPAQSVPQSNIQGDGMRRQRLE